MVSDLRKKKKKNHTYSHTLAHTHTEQRARLIGWWMAAVVITEHPAESVLQDKDVLTGHFSV